MRVLIVEPDLTGHHAPYLRHMLCGLAELNQETIVLSCAGASQAKQYGIHLQDVTSSVEWDESLEPGYDSPRAMPKLFETLEAIMKRREPDQIWIPYADHATVHLGMRRMMRRPFEWPTGVEAEGLFFRGTFAYPAPHWRKHVRRIASRVMLPRANWDVLHFLDSIPYEMMCRLHPEQASHFRLMPDPIEPVTPIDPIDARRELQIPTDSKYVSFLGVLYNLVAVDLLLRAFRKAKLKPADRLLLAGPISDAVRDHIQQKYSDLLRANRIILVDRHLNLDEVMLAVMASDVVCTPGPYRMGSSSFVIRATAAGRPVIVDDFGWAAETVRRFKIGWPVNVWNTKAFAKTLQSAFANAGMRTKSPAIERFVKYHSADNFKAHWTARIRERQGLPQDPKYLSWSWVLGETAAAPV